MLDTVESRTITPKILIYGLVVVTFTRNVGHSVTCLMGQTRHTFIINPQEKNVPTYVQLHPRDLPEQYLRLIMEDTKELLTQILDELREQSRILLKLEQAVDLERHPDLFDASNDVD
jgi:hypothetical protein